MPKTILYDLPSKEPCASWSLNPWKTRISLNFKGIDYETQWLEYPDVAPTLKSFGLPPNDPKVEGYFKDYTIPALRLPDDTLIMDSWAIAIALESRHPTPSLHLDNPLTLQVRRAVGQIFANLRADIIPKIPRNLLNPSSKEYFERTRAEDFGMPLEEVERVNGGDKAWERSREAIGELADLLKNKGGPFFLGETFSYADVVLVTFLHFLKRAGEGLFEKWVAHDDEFLRIYEASKQWLDKED